MQVASSLKSTNISTLAVSGTNIFAGTNIGVFVSTDNGTSWTAVNLGLTSTNIQALAVSDSNLFAGPLGAGVWRRPVSDFDTAVIENEDDILNMFSLSQNYPNPFNPMTIISFSLHQRSFVSLKIFDVRGREVSTIVLGELQAGSYARQWNATNMPSGVYFYRLQAGKYRETKKLLLLK
jgi:hypothetical protein